MGSIALGEISTNLLYSNEETYESRNQVPAISYDHSKAGWSEFCDLYNSYKETYKKMEEDQNTLTGIINSLLFGGEYFLEAVTNTSSTFNTLESFKMDIVDQLALSLNDESDEIEKLCQKLDSAISDITNKIDKIDIYKEEVHTHVIENQDKVIAGYDEYVFSYSYFTVDTDGKEKYWFVYKHNFYEGIISDSM